MVPFVDTLFPDTVTFSVATYTTGLRGTLNPTPTPGLPLACYVETVTGQESRTEMALVEKPTSRTHYRVFSQVNPNTTVVRPIALDDTAVWDGITLHVLGGVIRQGRVWLVECEEMA